MGLFLSFAFAACGALRLARFNVLAARGDKASHRFFTGLPIPLAAGALVSVVIAHYRHYLGPTEPSTHVPIAVGVALLSFLMVSTVRYRTFKDTRLTAKSFATFGFVVAAAVVIGLVTRASFVLLVFAGAYILMGLVESIFFRKHHREVGRCRPRCSARSSRTRRSSRTTTTSRRRTRETSTSRPWPRSR